MTLSDVEYQAMRDDAFAVLRRVGVETGGSNVQFAVDPATGERLVIEMNPRVSRSSALASKATGFPIAKIATRLAVGYRLDEIANDITKATPASFEPAIDYVVTKVPRWQFEKLPGAEPRLGHPDAVRRRGDGDRPDVRREPAEGAALLGAGPRRAQRGPQPSSPRPSAATEELLERVAVPAPDRVFDLEALAAPRRQRRGPRRGDGHRPVVLAPARVSSRPPARGSRRSQEATTRSARSARRGCGAPSGWASPTPSSATLLGRDGRRGPQRTARERRRAHVQDRRHLRGGVRGARPRTTTRRYEDEDEVAPSDSATGSSSWARGRTASARASSSTTAACTRRAPCTTRATRRSWSTATPRPCRPTTTRPTASTSSPLTVEDVTNVLDAELAASRGQGRLVGVIVTLGGQTPLKLAHAIDPALVLGTPPDAIDLAEDRERWSALCASLGLRQPPGGTATRPRQGRARWRARSGYPVLVRPSYVLGGRDMQLVYDDDGLKRCLTSMLGAGGEGGGSLDREGGVTAQRPVLIDRFLEDAIEVDVDALRDRTGDVFVAGVMEHVEEAGVHSGDSACALPPPTLAASVVATLVVQTAAIAHALGVVGPCNVQFAVKDGEVYVLEANPRASRTVPFVAKATGVAVAAAASRLLVGATLDELRTEGLVPAETPAPAYVSRERGGAAVQPVPRRRHAARPRDALHGRGDGDRGDVRRRLREVPARRGRRPPRRGLRVLLARGHETSPPARCSRRPSPRSASRSPPRSGRPGSCATGGSRSRRSSARSGCARWRATPSSCSRPARCSSS